MSSFLTWLSTQQDYMPHGMCLLWQPPLMWLHILSDSAIALSYYTIPAALIYFVIKRRDVVFRRIFILFGIFILACGTTHAMGVWTLWHPDYRLDGVIKLVTAIASVATVIALWKTMPLALAVPSLAALQRAKDGLADEISQRRSVEAALRQANAELDERVRAQTAALAASEERFRTVFETSPDAVLILDRDSRIRHANLAVSGVFGYEAAELIGQDLLLLQPERLRAPHRAGLKRYLKTGEKRLNWRSAEALGRHRNGHEFPIEIAFSDMTLDGEHLFVGYMRDISERRHAEQKILDAKRKSDETLALLDTLQTSAPIGFAFVDPEFRYVRVNTAMASMVGVSMEDLIGSKMQDVVPDVWSQLEAAYQRVVDPSESVIGIEVSATTPANDGEVKHLVFGRYPIRIENTHVGFGLLADDVTQERRADEKLRQRQKFDAIGQLTGGIAHDFNNLLTVMIGNLELIQDNGEDSTTRAEFVERALHAALRGATLTHRLLAYARQQPLRPRLVNLNDLALSMESLLQRSLGETIVLRTSMTEPLWPCSIDAGQLEDALLNLVLNARDAMPTGGIIVIETSNAVLDADYVGQYPDLKPGDYAMVSVSDNGSGMPPEVKARVFEPYFTTKGVGKGSGLGLSMVYGFVKQSGGHANIYSEVGHGTTVKLYFPRSLETGVEEAEVDAIPSLPHTATGVALVVEDDAEVRKIAVQTLRGIGLSVLEASTYIEVMGLLDNNPKIDLLFTDVVLPGPAGGPAIAKEVARRYPSIRILYTSGYTESAIFHGGRLDAGIQLLTKPYRRQQLIDIVRGLLQPGDLT